MKNIDKMPPAPTGDPQRDSAAALEYMRYLAERLNYLIAAESKKERGNN